MENLVKLVNEKMKKLLNSDFTFKSLFNNIHDQGDLVFSERIVDYVNTYTTYKEMREKIILASSVINKYVSKDNEFVGILMENSEEFLIIFWALLSNGFKPILLNKRFTNSLISESCRLVNCVTIISDVNKDLDLKIINYLDIINDKDKKIFDINNNIWADEIALSTSATSLNIKICIYDGNSICNQIINSKDAVKTNRMIKGRYKGKLKLLAFLPFYHIFGLVACYFWFSFFGRTFVFLNDYRPETILNTVRFHKVTHVFAVPLLWNQIAKTIKAKAKEQGKLEYLEKSLDKSIKIQSIFPHLGKKIVIKKFREVNDKVFGASIRFCITGGSFISLDTLKTINGLGYPLFQGYGMSEIGITSVVLDKKANNRINGSIGKPFKFIDYKIDNGELLVKGKSICSKIITKNGITLINKNEYFHTKDLASIDNGYYYLKGRIDDLCIDENGENISPDIYEKEINIEHASNISLLSLDGKKLSLIIQVNKRNNQLIKNKIIKEIDDSLNKLGKLGIFISNVYITYDYLCSPNAIKVSRTILKMMIDKKQVELIDYKSFKENHNNISVDNDVFVVVRNVFASVLGKEVDDITPDGHFINDLGGNSLEYLTLLMKLSDEFLIDFNNHNYSFYTVNEFTNYILKEFN